MLTGAYLAPPADTQIHTHICTHTQVYCVYTYLHKPCCNIHIAQGTEGYIISIFSLANALSKGTDLSCFQ